MELPVDAFVRLFHHRWAVPTLVELARTQGSKVVTLSSRLGASRQAVRDALDQTVDLGLVVPNPGYGHPLRPEFILTSQGERVAEDAGQLLEVLSAQRAAEVGLRKWSMPVVVTLGDGPTRFSRIAAALPGTTPRALVQTLKSLAEAGLVSRTVQLGHPPAVLYSLTQLGGVVGRAGSALRCSLADVA